MGPTSPDGVHTALVAQQAGPIAAKVVEYISTDKELLQDIATRVGQHLFSDSARGKVLGTAMMLLAERSGSYQKMMERLNSLDSELFQKHRVEAGGPDGAPTDTLTLIQLAKYANSKVKDAEDTLLRLLKAAIDDRKTHGVNLNLQQNFTGQHERIIVPATLDSKQREALRRLGSRLVHEPTTIRALIEKAKEDDDDEARQDTSDETLEE
jgi:hypothetical protein